METNTIMAVVGAMITGGVFQAGFSYLLNKDKQEHLAKKVDIDLILKLLKEENETLKEEKEEDRGRITKLERKVNGLYNTIAMLESATMDLPVPMWLKDKLGRIIAVNRACEEAMLLPNGKSTADAIGLSDVELWGEDFGRPYQDVHEKVITSGRTYEGILDVKIGDHVEQYRCIVYARYTGRSRFGTAGIALPKEIKDSIN